jgi:hypothetical protein
MSSRFWTKKEDKIMKEHYENSSIHEMQDLLPGRSERGIYSRANTLSLTKSDTYLAEERPGWFEKGKRNNPDGEFSKGDSPWNKDTIGLMKPNKTSFKKGNKPANTKHDGAISLRKDNNLYIRIAPGEWILYQRYIYEKEIGPVPDKHIVVFKDGDTLNPSPDNLECISMAENARRNHNPEKIAQTIRDINAGKRKPRPLTNYQVLKRLCGDDNELKEYIKKHRPDIIQAAKRNYQLKRKIRYGKKAQRQTQSS